GFLRCLQFAANPAFRVRHCAHTATPTLCGTLAQCPHGLLYRRRTKDRSQHHGLRYAILPILRVSVHSPNTWSTRALRCSFSSGVLTSRPFETGLGPDTIATYCLPLTSNVIGGAEKPEPTLIFHSSSSVVSSKAATVPSSSARNTRPPPVASVPE